MSKRKYVINWDNGNDCGTLAGTFTSKRKAESAAREWKRGMVWLEVTKADRREAREVYQWEIVEVESTPEVDEESLLIREDWEL